MMMVAVNHRGGGRPDREILGRRRMLPRVFIFRMIFFSLSSFKPEEPRRWPTELENVCPRWGAIATSDDQNVGGGVHPSRACPRLTIRREFCITPVPAFACARKAYPHHTSVPSTRGRLRGAANVGRR